MNLKERINEALGECQEEVGEACAYALLGQAGRIRPILTLLTAEALQPDVDAMPAALAVEFIHTSSLIADDLPCMDDDEVRRGRPCLHIAYDESTALLASYRLIASAYERLSYLPASHRTAGLMLMSRCLRELLDGQYLDLRKEEQLRTLAELKTGSLFELAIALGWLSAAGPLEDLPLIEQLGKHLGVLFQTLDDLSDGDVEIEPALQLIEEAAASAQRVTEQLGLHRSEIPSLIRKLQQSVPKCGASK